jgi:peptidoglycan/LPS O-acetylase OafA/YrhL
MFLWLISPKNAFHGEQISRVKKLLLSGLVAFIYIFAYINLQEVNHKQKMMIFYIVMFLENLLLVSLWVVGIWPDRSDDWYCIPMYVFCTFLGGILLMVLYYK